MSDHFLNAIDKALAQADEYERMGVPRPAWLSKKLDAAELAKTDPVGGMAMMIDAMQDYRDFLDRL